LDIDDGLRAGATVSSAGKTFVKTASVTHYAKQMYWDGAKDTDAVLLIVGEGPGTLNYAEPPK